MSSSIPEGLLETIAIGFCWLFVGSVLYYIYNLEKENCKCVKTWHHNYIKYSTFLMLILPIITVWAYAVRKNNLASIFMVMYTILFIIYLYAIYAYVNKLNDTQCNCAIHDMKYLHNTFYYVFNAPKTIVKVGLVALLLLIIFGIVVELFGAGKGFINWANKSF